MLHSATNTREPSGTNEPLPFDQIGARLQQFLSGGDDGAIDTADLLLAQAAQHRSSDVHLDPWEDCVTIRFRIDGLLHEVAAFPRPQHEKVVGRIKVLSHLLTYQKDSPQDGRIDPENTPCGVATRVSTFPTVHGEKVVLRLLNSDMALFALDALGFQPDTVFRLRELIERPQGTILLTGPASSGKTTTIYALLQEIAGRRGGVQIVTIEDPVEYRLPRISQTQVNPHGGFTFANALRSALRQDPEVIMVGEIRDPETAHVAIQAGLTGHLVISTIHSGTAAGVFTRLLDMGIEPYLVASSVTGILSQRLLRTNCPHCLESYAPDLELVCRYGLGELRDALQHGAGCGQCRQIGYQGRTAVGELLVADDTTAELVLAHSRTAVLHEAAVEAGMRTVVEDAVDRVRKGVTTVEEVRRVLPPAQEAVNIKEKQT